MADDKGRLNIDKLTKTKIVCTLGPATSSEDILEELFKSGMDVVRLNFSHGKHDEHKKLFETVRKLGNKYHHQISIICDIQGPKIRTGIMEEPFQVSPGDIVEVTPDEVKGTKKLFQIHYENMMSDIHENDTIFINDGIVKLVVQKKNEKTLTCVVEGGGRISDHKGVNIPSGNLSVEVITPKDRKDLEFIANLDPEFVASSFIGSAEDVEKIRSALKEFKNPNIKIISKIERPVALKNLDAIIEATDAIMVARGDLGVEIDTWEVPYWQKEMCKRCNAAGKPVIVATQMLESMTTSSRPTRAETNDVFNAVLDGADAVMLSGETSVGKYPVEAVRIMDKIVKLAESQLPKRNPTNFHSNHIGMTEIVATGVYQMSQLFQQTKLKGKILTVTGPPSGYVSRMVSKYRPPLDILAFTHDIRTARELNLLWGVRSIYDESLIENSEETNARATKLALDLGLVNIDDHIIVVSRSNLGKHVGSSSSVYSVKEVIERSAGPYQENK